MGSELFVIIKWPIPGGWPDVINDVFASTEDAQKRIDDLVRELEDTDDPDAQSCEFVICRLVSGGDSEQ